ncbi:MAG: hypothetical protein ACRERV_06350 [Methylococcales bacterium]
MAQTLVCLIDSNEDRAKEVQLLFAFLEVDLVRAHSDEALALGR